MSTAPKKLKLDLESAIKPEINLDNLDQWSIPTIFTEITERDIAEIESCMYHELTEGYVNLQVRLVQAQQVRVAKIIETRIQLGDQLPKVATARGLATLLRALAEDASVPAAAKDEIRYYEAVAVGVVCFGNTHASQGKKNFQQYVGTGNPVEYYERLVESSERYLSRQATTVSSNPPALPTAPVLEPVPELVADLAMTLKHHDPLSDEYLREKAVDFIVTKDDLKDVVPWQDINDSGSGIKEELEAWSYAVKDTREAAKATPPGILLHGDQGTGKTRFVESFAVEYDLKMFKIEGKIHGGLRGQSEKLIKYIFDAVRQEATTKACILFFDEVDSLLGGSATTTSAFEGEVKRQWGDLINDKVPCFVFGATNKPWVLNMGDFGRRFQMKAHIKQPQPNARYQAVKNIKDKYWNTITSEECKVIAAAVEGYSPNDIDNAFQRKFVHLLTEMHRAKSWVRSTYRDTNRQVWIPASPEDAQNPVANVNTVECEPRPITAAMMIKFFAEGRAPKTGSSEEEERHNAWNAKHR